MASENLRHKERKPAVDRIHDVAANLAGFTLIIIALVILAGIGSRFLFGRPIPSSTEFISSCLMVGFVYLSLSSAIHLRITVLTRLLPVKVARAIELFVIWLTVAGLAFAGWAAFQLAVTSFRTGESTVGLHTFDIAPFRFLIFVGVLLLLIRVVREGRTWLIEPTQTDSAQAEPEKMPREDQGTDEKDSPQTPTNDSSKDT